MIVKVLKTTVLLSVLTASLNVQAASDFFNPSGMTGHIFSRELEQSGIVKSFYEDLAKAFVIGSFTIAGYESGDLDYMSTPKNELFHEMINVISAELKEDEFKQILLDMQNSVHAETLKAKYGKPDRPYTNAFIKVYSEK